MLALCCIFFRTQQEISEVDTCAQRRSYFVGDVGTVHLCENVFGFKLLLPDFLGNVFDVN
jgi:hypothetical protein